MSKATQIPLELKHSPSFELSDFIVSSSNEEAFGMADNTTGWSSHAAAIVGPTGCGKTHLGRAWASQNNAILFSSDLNVGGIGLGAHVLVEDVDEAGYADDELFHLFNWVKENGGKLLFTAKTEPSKWPVKLPDLVSRLATVTAVRIKEPDDDLLMVLLIKLFSDRQMQVDMTVISYALSRIERSFEAVRRFVETLDQKALAAKSRVTIKLAKTCLVDLSK